MVSKKNFEAVAVLKDKIAKAKSIIIVDFSNINVKDQTSLRRNIKKNGGEFVVSKNSLMGLALNKKELLHDLKGMNGLIIAYEDEVGPLKQAYQFYKEKEKLVLKSGLIGNEILDGNKIQFLSQLPSKQELLTIMINRIKGPINGFLNVLNGNNQKLVRVLKAISENK